MGTRPAGTTAIDIPALQQKLTDRYQADYIKEWNAFLHAASFRGFQNLG